MRNRDKSKVGIHNSYGLRPLVFQAVQSIFGTFPGNRKKALGAGLHFGLAAFLASPPLIVLKVSVVKMKVIINPLGDLSIRRKQRQRGGRPLLLMGSV